MDKPLPDTGEEVQDQTAKRVPERTQSETREARDELADLKVLKDGTIGSYTSNKPKLDRQSSAVWDDAFFEGSDGDDSDQDDRHFVNRLINPRPLKKPEQAYHRPDSAKSNGVPTSPRAPSYTDGHRGLAPISPTSSKDPRSPASVKSAASTKPTFDAAEVEPLVATDSLVEEPAPLDNSNEQSPGSTAEVGLRRTIGDLGEQMTPTKKTKSGRLSSSGAPKHVA
jgi:hypothetical protein